MSEYSYQETKSLARYICTLNMMRTCDFEDSKISASKVITFVQVLLALLVIPNCPAPSLKRLGNGLF